MHTLGKACNTLFIKGFDINIWINGATKHFLEGLTTKFNYKLNHFILKNDGFDKDEYLLMI